MTEEEAKTKWCPMASDASAANRYTDGKLFPDNSCIASSCMMWVKNESDGFTPNTKIVSGGGYCGLTR